MNLSTIALTGLFLFAVARTTNPSAGAEAVLAAKQQSPPTHPPNSCIDELRSAIERGESLGMGDPAIRGGSPAPLQLLALAGELKLSPGQVTALKKLQAEMSEKAVARGKEMLSAEARLEEMFREARPEADLREQSFRIDSLHAELRWTHLAAHVAARAQLAPDQLAAYQRLNHAPGAASTP